MVRGLQHLEPMKRDENGPPLITSRSPSYERAREERRNPAPTSDPELVAMIARVAEAEDNAREAFATAAAQVVDGTLAERLAAQAGIHAARLEALGERLEQLGAARPRPGESRAILAHGAKDVQRAGSDQERLELLDRIAEELTREVEQARREAVPGS
jgi:hypothetical protein